MTRVVRQHMIARWRLLRLFLGSSDAAAHSTGADRFWAELGVHLLADGLPLAGGALTLDIPHPLIARRTWLWSSNSGEVIEALGFTPGGPAAEPATRTPNNAGLVLVGGLLAGLEDEDTIGSSNRPLLSWIGPRPFTPSETDELRETARFAATLSFASDNAVYLLLKFGIWACNAQPSIR